MLGSVLIVGHWSISSRNYVAPACFSSAVWQKKKKKIHMAFELGRILNIMQNPLIFCMLQLHPRRINLWCILDFLNYIVLRNSSNDLRNNSSTYIGEIKRLYKKALLMTVLLRMANLTGCWNFKTICTKTVLSPTLKSMKGVIAGYYPNPELDYYFLVHWPHWTFVLWVV